VAAVLLIMNALMQSLQGMYQIVDCHCLRHEQVTVISLLINNFGYRSCSKKHQRSSVNAITPPLWAPFTHYVPWSTLVQTQLGAEHWHRLDKRIVWANQNIGARQKVVKSDKCMGVSQLLGARAKAAPQSLCLWFRDSE